MINLILTKYKYFINTNLRYNVFLVLISKKLFININYSKKIFIEDILLIKNDNKIVKKYISKF